MRFSLQTISTFVYYLRARLGAHLKGMHQPGSQILIRLVCKCVVITNALAYNAAVLITINQGARGARSIQRGPVRGSSLVSSIIGRKHWTWLEMANTLGYNTAALITIVKRIIVLSKSF